MRLKKYEPLEKEPLDTAYGVDGVVKEKQAGFERAHTRDMTVGIVMCVLSCLPIFIALILNKRAEFGDGFRRALLLRKSSHVVISQDKFIT